MESIMESTVFFLIIFCTVPLLLLLLQYMLCKRKSKMALFLPLIVASFFIIFGLSALILSAIMFGIYFVMRYLEKEKQATLSELEKMDIEDF